ncbi:MAG: 3-hydroxybenzoate 6-monooxygenase [Betaproteobacteria bacterium]|jgi:salicylate hydroxylase|nr:3-hydroxybenzoate 6-monooxygenase [Betaproteobacteria bacterium]
MKRTPRNEKPVVIAGGGIGGLACALGLAQRGFRVTVLEQAHEFGELGAGIQLGPNAFHVFDALGIGKLVKKDAVLIERLLMMDGVSGEKVIDIPIDARFRSRFGNPYAVTHRADIHGALLEGCRSIGLVDLRTDSRVTGFHSEADGVAVELGGGVRIVAAALVGADGLRSAVREQIVGDGEPPASGHMCYRAVLSLDDMPKDMRWPAATLWAGPNTHIVHYPLRGWKLFNLVATVVRDATMSGHNEEAPPEEVLPLFAKNCAKPMSIMRVPKVFRRWMLRYRPPVANWTQGNVTLLGDAAHPMLQYMAQGACMAMEDAVCLAVTADEADGDFAAAFGRYQALRLVRTARVQLSAVMMGHMFHADGIARLVRNEIYSDHTPQSYNEALDWIYRAPDYIVAANLKAPKRKSPAGRKRAGAPGSRAKAKKRTVAKHRR